MLHLNTHEKHEKSSNEMQRLRIQATLQHAFDRAQESDQKRRHVALTIDIDQFEILFVKWIARYSIPFRIVECEEFRAMIKHINKTCDEWLPRSHSIVKEWVVRTFEGEKIHVKAALHSAKSKIHIMCDLWTSPNSLAILGIVAQFINENRGLQHVNLALKELQEEHSGENLASEMIKVIDDYGIASKLGYFVMDNAKSKNTMMVELSYCK